MSCGNARTYAAFANTLSRPCCLDVCTEPSAAQKEAIRIQKKSAKLKTRIQEMGSKQEGVLSKSVRGYAAELVVPSNALSLFDPKHIEILDSKAVSAGTVHITVLVHTPSGRGLLASLVQSGQVTVRSLNILPPAPVREDDIVYPGLNHANRNHQYTFTEIKTELTALAGGGDDTSDYYIQVIVEPLLGDDTPETTDHEIDDDMSCDALVLYHGTTADKPALYLSAMTHGREKASLTSELCFLEALLTVNKTGSVTFEAPTDEGLDLGANITVRTEYVLVDPGSGPRVEIKVHVKADGGGLQIAAAMFDLQFPCGGGILLSNEGFYMPVGDDALIPSGEWIHAHNSNYSDCVSRWLAVTLGNTLVSIPNLTEKLLVTFVTTATETSQLDNACVLTADFATVFAEMIPVAPHADDYAPGDGLNWCVAAPPTTRSRVVDPSDVYDLLTQDVVKHLLTTRVIVFQPFVNPDGYAYNWTDDGGHFWRKNRAQGVIDSTCYGVDVNRNYPPLDLSCGANGIGGFSFDECYPTYCGYDEDAYNAIVDPAIVRSGK